jgi:endonuclease/exonuclease/phosphatase family metal-dependent hydrolase
MHNNGISQPFPVKSLLFKGLKRYALLGIISVVTYASVYIAPEKFALAGFAVFAIPIVLIVNSLVLLVWLWKRIWYAVWPLLILIVGFPHIRASIAINRSTETITDLKVLSFNVETFRGYSRPTPERILSASQMLKFLKKSDADILCLQEFFDNSKSETFNSLAKLKKAGYKYRYFSKSFSYDGTSQVGVVIFSKYRIISYGTLYKRTGNNNQMIFADIATPCDTVRVYSVHLESIRLKQEEVQVPTNEGSNKLKRNISSVARKMTAGFEYRGKQIKILKEHILSSPHPVILTGDFNEVPFSHLYNELRGLLKNSFEEKGRGFGFTFNGFIPGLRIDNQFVSEPIEVTSFKTDYTMKHSDHFPLIATYRLQPDCELPSRKK